MSLSFGAVPENWKKANVTPVHKSNDPSLPPNYRPISLLCILSKVLERCVFNHCFPHISQFLYHLQHGFRPGRSTETQLLAVYHDLLDTAASGKEIDVIYLDLSIAFEKVPHHLLLAKLSRYGISGSLHQWFQSYLCDRCQRVPLEGVTSDWLPISSGVPQESILGPLLFLVFANDMPMTSKQDLLWRYSLTTSPIFSCQLDGNVLEHISDIKDLGVTVSFDLLWTRHIEQTQRRLTEP